MMSAPMQQGEIAGPCPRLSIQGAATIVRGKVKEAFRNDGYSWGLKFPIVYGKLPQIGWCCWNRDTGAIVYLPRRLSDSGMHSECIKWSRPNGYNGTNNFEYDSIA